MKRKDPPVHFCTGGSLHIETYRMEKNAALPGY